MQEAQLKNLWWNFVLFFSKIFIQKLCYSTTKKMEPATVIKAKKSAEVMRSMSSMCCSQVFHVNKLTDWSLS